MSRAPCLGQTTSGRSHQPQQTLPHSLSTPARAVTRSQSGPGHGSISRPRTNIYTSADSFIRAAYEAWARHMHFAIRPDGVWFAILSQLNCYMGNTKNAEPLRHLFVNHKGTQKIHVERAPPTHFPSLLSDFSSAIQAKVKTLWRKD
ncbi:hypothetical protein VTK26DRAFT_7434 [Humicola hyalothermophila]